MVSDSDPVLPTVTLPKLKLAGFALKDPGEVVVMPVPDNGIVMLGLAASEPMITAPDALPLAFGEKVTVKVVVCEDARVTGVVIPLRAKPVPATVTPEIEMLEEVALFNVTTCDLLDPTLTLPNGSVVGLT